MVLSTSQPTETFLRDVWEGRLWNFPIFRLMIRGKGVPGPGDVVVFSYPEGSDAQPGSMAGVLLSALKLPSSLSAFTSCHRRQLTT